MNHSWKYDVFISFRGEDTRKDFTGRLHSSLVRKGIKTFIDYDLKIGEEISQALLDAIEGSRISIVIFSENYASSKWCLNELVHIFQCMNSKHQLVWPIFYKVDPSDVRHQSRSFGDAFTRCASKFKDHLEQIMEWRTALTKAANLSGWEFVAGDDQHKFISKIVEEVSVQVSDRTCLNVGMYPVGVKSRVGNLVELLRVGEDDVLIGGIWGCGGLGKTTIAKEAFDSISSKFEVSCFLANISREWMEGVGGLVRLQNVLLSSIFGAEEPKVTNVENGYHGITLIAERLRNKRVLLVLDDLSQQEQFERLVGDWNSLGSGSRIIITTRDLNLLHHCESDFVYRLQRLSDQESIELLSGFAKFTHVNADYWELACLLVDYAGGLPLALKVLGSLLCGKSIREWRTILDELRRGGSTNDLIILQVSYDSLTDSLKQVFLDIACFFNGESLNNLIQVLDSRGFPAAYAITMLQEMALINIDEENHVWMHDIVEHMGKVMVIQESYEPGERSRLWRYEDVLHVLSNNTGTDKVQCIKLKCSPDQEIILDSQFFSKMTSLEVLIVNKHASFSGELDYLSNELRYLEWPGCPLQSFPSNFHGKELVSLNIRNSLISRIRVQNFENLKFLNLEDCQVLLNPDFSRSQSAKDVSVRRCMNESELHPSAILDKLVDLNLRESEKLVRNFPERVGEMECIRVLGSEYYLASRLESIDLSGFNFVSLPIWISKLGNLSKLKLSGCKKLREISELPPKIKVVDVKDCVSLERVLHLSNALEGEESEMIDFMDLTNCKRLCNSLVQMAKKKNVLMNDQVDGLFSTFLCCKKSAFEVVFPGSEVPKWFSCDMDFKGLPRFEFSIEIQGNFKWENSGGLAVCVVVERMQNNFRDCIWKYEIHFNEVSVLQSSAGVGFTDSAHVWLHYIPFLKMRPFEYKRPLLPPFMCRITIFQDTRSSVWIKSCGVHFVSRTNEELCMKVVQIASTLEHLTPQMYYPPAKRQLKNQDRSPVIL